MRRSDQAKHVPRADGGRPDRGDGYLRLRLGEVHELESRRLTAMRDWIAATIAVASQQFSAYGVGLSSRWFFTMIALAGTAIFISSTVYPRLRAPRFMRVEQGMMLLAWGTIALLVYATGGSSSPYIFFYAQTMFYSAYFFGPTRLALAHVGLGSALALSPMVYDFSDARHDDFVPTIVIALAVWWTMAAVVAVRHRRMLEAEREARRLALSDTLTNSANLRALEDFAASLRGAPYALAMVDLDGLSAVNARYGYFAGDELLRESADAMREASRPADQVARIGGDEFLVVMPQADLLTAERWRSRLLERTMIYNNTASEGGRMSARVGVAATRDGSETLDTLVARADKQLYGGDAPVEHVRAERVPPHARAQRLAQLVETAPPRRRRLRFEDLSAPAGVFVALLGAVFAGVMVSVTGGSTSVLMSVVMVIAAYFAYFGTLREAVVGVGATLVALGFAVFANGPVSAVAQTRFSTVVFGTLVIAYALQSNRRKLQAAEQRAERLSLTDALTNLPNRRAFDREFGAAIAGAAGVQPGHQTPEGAPGLILIDLVDFKNVNVRLGHHGGDVLLLEAASALRDAVKEEGTVFRVGGDEFAVLMHAHHVQRVETFAARCYDAIRDIDDDGRYVAHLISVEAKVGAAHWRAGMLAADVINAAVREMDGVDQELGSPGGMPMMR